jgi:hypothetical protein
MPGGAAVLTAIGAIAELGLRSGCMVGDRERDRRRGQAAGNVLHALDGTTIEMVNTEARADSCSPTALPTRGASVPSARRRLDAQLRRRHGARHHLCRAVRAKRVRTADREIRAAQHEQARRAGATRGAQSHQRQARPRRQAFSALGD